MAKTAFALGCHPDDIEFLMAGTLLRLKAAGYEIHYMNLANGSCGTAVHDRETIIKMRTAEARDAAGALGAVFHDPLVDDLDVFYTKELTVCVGAIMREVAPEILLLQSTDDYMEDHMNTARVGVTAAFCRGMRNFPVMPHVDPVDQEVTVYHAPPHGNRDPLRRLVRCGLYVDVSDLIDRKKEVLACHASQKEWLDKSQGMDSYLITMADLNRETGALSGKYEYAEGWRRRSHLGFCAPDADPLREALKDCAVIDSIYEEGLG